MKDRKFIQLLGYLDKNTFGAFEKFVNSPYFNSNKKLTKLIQVLKKYHPDYDSPNLNLQKLFKAIFGAKPYREQSIKNLFTEATKLLERFLKQQLFDVNDAMGDRALLSMLLKVNAYPFFEKKLEGVINKSTQKEQKDIEHHLGQFLLKEMAYGHKVALQSRLKETNVTEINKHLDTFYIAAKLKYYCVQLNRESLMMREQQLLLPMVSEILNFLEGSDLAEEPIVAFWYRLLLLLKSENKQKQYFILKRLLAEQSDAIPLIEIRQIYTAITNFCNIQISRGDSSYWQELFECYQLMLKHKIIIENGYIAPAEHYRNIPIIAMRLNQLDWAAQFIEEYQDQVPEAKRESLVSFVRASLAFYRKDYNTCVQHLQSFDLEDFYHYAAHKVLLIKAYYELGEFDSLEALLNAFSKYIQRSKQMTTFNQSVYHHFVLVTQKLTKIAQEPDKDMAKVAKLKEEITKLKLGSQQEWILSKLKNLA